MLHLGTEFNLNEEMIRVSVRNIETMVGRVYLLATSVLVRSLMLCLTR